MDFREQIKNDISDYQARFPTMPFISKDEWAFNFWILDKLFFEDEELIEEKIIDYKDLGVDAYLVYEDTKDIYLIQNKYYSDDTRITEEYVKNTFLLRSITALENGTYSRSRDLQNAFTKLKTDDDFTVHLLLFVTNNIHNPKADEYVRQYNRTHPKFRAKIYYLDDIKEKYFQELPEKRKDIVVRIKSVNKGTVMNINNDAYKLENIIDAKYIFAPVVCLFEVYKKALEEQYPIFDKNIREFLGNTGVNKKIYATLSDPLDRKNFFYYNNGITIICDEMKTVSQPVSGNLSYALDIKNPQIVNGCQTVNTIYEVLKNVNESELYPQFKNVYVMLKILQIDRSDETQSSLYQSIVRYNNSQNSIDEKTFSANQSIFTRLQKELEEKGFLLLIKQSDKHMFSEKYKTITKLKACSELRLNRFGLPQWKKAADAFVELEKLLQVINAFVKGGHTAYVKKSKMLMFNSTEYNTAIDFIKTVASIEIILDLFLLYKKAEITKKNNAKNNRTPIPYYLIDCFARYECKNRNPSLITSNLLSNEDIKPIIVLYTRVSDAYTREYFKKNNVDYNKMIKQPIDYELIDSLRETFIGID